MTDYNDRKNIMKLVGGIQNLIISINNIHRINPSVINSIVDKPGLMQKRIYPPLGISVIQWNNN